MILKQSPESSLSYKFEVDDLGAETVSLATVTSDVVAISSILNDTTSFSFTCLAPVDEVDGVIKTSVTLSNGDVAKKDILISVEQGYWVN
jgi:hypothetical protein